MKYTEKWGTNVQYHECRLDFQFASSVQGIDPAYTPTVDMYIDYAFLDASERRRIASQAQEILIDQVQFAGDESITIANNTMKQQNIRLQLNHPCKVVALVACTQDHGIFTGGPAGTSADAFAPINQITLQFNGAQRLSPRYGSYWSQLVSYQTCQSLPMAGIYMWSAAIDPAAHQPSGSANFSRIDSAQMQIRFKQAATNASAVHDILTPDTTTTAAATNLTALRVFGFGYNILRVAGGIKLLSQTVSCLSSSRTRLDLENSVRSWVMFLSLYNWLVFRLMIVQHLLVMRHTQTDGDLLRASTTICPVKA